MLLHLSVDAAYRPLLTITFQLGLFTGILYATDGTEFCNNSQLTIVIIDGILCMPRSWQTRMGLNSVIINKSTIHALRYISGFEITLLWADLLELRRRGNCWRSDQPTVLTCYFLDMLNMIHCRAREHAVLADYKPIIMTLLGSCSCKNPVMNIWLIDKTAAVCRLPIGLWIGMNSSRHISIE